MALHLFVWAFKGPNDAVDVTCAMGESLEDVRTKSNAKDKRFLTEDPTDVYEAPEGCTDEQAMEVFKDIMEFAMKNGTITDLELPAKTAS